MQQVSEDKHREGRGDGRDKQEHREHGKLLEVRAGAVTLPLSYVCVHVRSEMKDL